MTFDEACSKGKFIKRPNWVKWEDKDKVCYSLDIWCIPPGVIFINTSDLKADDWESIDDVWKKD